MNKKQVWVSPNGKDSWKVKSVGANRAAAIERLKERAEELGTQIAKNQKAELIVQDRKGRIQKKNSFGNDEFPPRG